MLYYRSQLLCCAVEEGVMGNITLPLIYSRHVCLLTIVLDGMLTILRDVLRLGSYPVLSTVLVVEQVIVVRLTYRSSSSTTQ